MLAARTGRTRVQQVFMSTMRANESVPPAWGLVVKRAVIYRRASLDMTGEGLAVDRQLDACRALITMRGWTEAAVETDNSISAYGKKDRPGWERVLQMMERGEVDVVVAWHLDRMTRNLVDLERLIALAERYDVGIATASGDFDLTTDVGRMVARILAAVSRAEVERKAARQKLANAQRAGSGKPWTGGARPFGYTSDQLSIVEAEAAAIKDAATAALAGTSMSEIARRWEAAGLVSSRASDKTKGGWTGRGVKNVLVNPRYAGIRTYLGEEFGDGAWPKILELETHLALRAKLTDPSRLLHQHRRGRTPANLLTGIALCSICDKPVNASANGAVLSYICRPKGHVQPPRDECDRTVEEYMVALLSSPTAVERLVGVSNDGSNNEGRSELDSLQQRLLTLEDNWVEGVVSNDRYKVLARKLKDKIDERESALVRASVGTVLDGMEIGTDRAIQQWEAMGLAQKRAVIDSLVNVEFIPAGRGGRGETRRWSPDRCIRVDLKKQ